MKNFPKALALLLVPIGLLLGCNSKKPIAVTKIRNDPPELIFVNGAFQSPGKYTWTNGMTLRDGITAAGGLTDFSSRKGYIMHWDETRVIFWMTYQKTLTNNPELEQGDTVTIPRREF